MNELPSIFKPTNKSRKMNKYRNIYQKNSENKQNYFFDFGYTLRT